MVKMANIKRPLEGNKMGLGPRKVSVRCQMAHKPSFPIPIQPIRPILSNSTNSPDLPNSSNSPIRPNHPITQFHQFNKFVQFIHLTSWAYVLSQKLSLWTIFKSSAFGKKLSYVETKESQIKVGFQSALTRGCSNCLTSISGPTSASSRPGKPLLRFGLTTAT